MRTIALLIAAALLALAPLSASAESTEKLRLVERVVDGDTIELDGGERVRLIGVNTPETKHPRKPVEHFGKEASEFTQKLSEGKRVTLQSDPHSKTKDRFGRTLAYVYLLDGTLLNIEIVRQGYGHAYTKYPFTKMGEFRAAEREARDAERGLWAPSEPAKRN